MRRIFVLVAALVMAACNRAPSGPKAYGPLSPFSARFTEAVAHMTGVGASQDTFLGTVQLTQACEAGDRDACDYAWLSGGYEPLNVAPERISALVASHGAEAQRCYEASGDIKWNVQGKLPLAFSFDHHGRVFVVSESEPTKFSRDFVSCVKRVVLRMSFSPQREAHGAVTVSFPFVFKTS